MLLNTFVIEVLRSSSLRASSPFGEIARSHPRAARQRERECEGRELCLNWSILDYEQSLFFLGPSSKTPETRKWPRAWQKAPPSFLVSRGFAAKRSLARACTNWRKTETARSLGAFSPPLLAALLLARGLSCSSLRLPYGASLLAG